MLQCWNFIHCNLTRLSFVWWGLHEDKNVRFFSQWNGPLTDFTSLVLVLRASVDWKCTRAYEHRKLPADFEWLMKWLKLLNDSRPTPLLRWYSGLKHHYKSPHRLLPPTNQDGVENPRPVRWRLYVSVLVHSLDGRSHVEGIHLKLGEEKNVQAEQTRHNMRIK